MVGSWKEEKFAYDDFYYIDKRGEQAIPQKFALASHFFKGLAHVQLKAPDKNNQGNNDTRGGGRICIY